jgi:hypothetical protein
MGWRDISPVPLLARQKYQDVTFPTVKKAQFDNDALVSK